VSPRHSGPMSVLGSTVVQSTFRRSLGRQNVVGVSSTTTGGALSSTGGRGSACRTGVRTQRGFHKTVRAASNAASNGADAKDQDVAQVEALIISASNKNQQSAAQTVSKSKATVSDKLKAAVKQGDKQVYEVTAVHMPQDNSLVPHMYEHPGKAVVPHLILAVNLQSVHSVLSMSNATFAE